MKFLKITLPREAGGTKLQYPGGIDWYQHNIGNFAVDHLYYDENDTAMLLLVIPTKDYNAQMLTDGVEEITEADARQISEANEAQVERVTDEARIQRLIIKAQLGQAFTQEELDAIDPDKDTPGIEKEKRLTDRIAERKAHIA